MSQNHCTRRHGRGCQKDGTEFGPKGRNPEQRGPGHGCCQGHGKGHGGGIHGEARRSGGMGMRRDGSDFGPQCNGSGRRGRVLNHGDLRLLCLMLIAKKPRHGYEIIKVIEDKVSGAYTPSPGVIYPTLTLLEELGHVTVTPDNGKKLHSITDEGRAFLDKETVSLKTLEARLAVVGEQAAQRPSPDIMRAMENLRHALHLRAGRGSMNADIAEHIAEVLDSLAVMIERET